MALIRYVNAASPAGGNGTTNTISAGDPNRAYSGLVSAHDSERAINNDLAALGGIQFNCEGTTEDVGNLAITGWINASNTNYVNIRASSSGIHNFTKNSGYTFRSPATGANAFDISTPYTRIGEEATISKGIQITLDSTTSSAEAVRFHLEDADLQIAMLLGCDIRCLQNISGQDGTYTEPDTAGNKNFSIFLINCQITGFNRSGTMVQNYGGQNLIETTVAHCTMYGNGIDVSGTNSSAGATTNFISYNNVCASPVGFNSLDDPINLVDSWTGNNNITIDGSFNKDSMTAGAQATNGITTTTQSTGSWIVVNDLTSNDYDLKLLDEEAGNLPVAFGQLRYSYDGLGTIRSATPDNGFFEFPEEEETKIPVFMNNYQRRRA